MSILNPASTFYVHFLPDVRLFGTFPGGPHDWWGGAQPIAVAVTREEAVATAQRLGSWTGASWRRAS